MASMEGEDGNNVSEKTSQVPANKNEQTIVIALDASDQAESAVKCTYNVIPPWLSPKLPVLVCDRQYAALTLQPRAADSEPVLITTDGLSIAKRLLS